MGILKLDHDWFVVPKDNSARSSVLYQKGTGRGGDAFGFAVDPEFAMAVACSIVL